ncbi:PREDICTED: double zinc ribbon and ankyrin repeat-containing protein 1-like isoform X2 [Priapulus caudatus]|uniref:Double zinc ribbon and ankyrin repeat-containing protein 1 n=1 Tax=Priapulus caudatus TaxID=37621 RepID=A0ABM1E953_PRICU|nr:PREDICTED: double zinc ribbon and ankyrin repeat-containing protein 1-like isoform X2 [Priapulus caudatus]
MTAGSVSVPTVVPLRPPAGKNKLCVDTETFIELKSETPGSTIFYTVNGTKPNPFEGIGDVRCTFKYSKPFKLHPGKVGIKAVALASDGVRESAVVTKAFQVDPGLNNQSSSRARSADVVGHTHSNKPLARDQHRFEAWSAVERIMADLNIAASEHRLLPTATRFLNHRLGGGDGSRVPTKPMAVPPEVKPRAYRLPDGATQATRLQKEQDFLRCSRCFASRPTDPHAKFCGECGAPLPVVPVERLPDPDPEQMGMCVQCNSMVPLNTTTCVICEAPLSPRQKAQARSMKEKLICSMCNTPNPPYFTSCVICESKLDPKKIERVRAAVAAPPQPQHQHETQFLSCVTCGRQNSEDARFCDWCGAKPTHAASMTLACGRCGAVSNMYAKFCHGCGSVIEPPGKPLPVPVTVTKDKSTESTQTTPLRSVSWTPSTVMTQTAPGATTATSSTQTVGLFYPSQAHIDKTLQEKQTRLAVERAMRDKHPPLTAISPGRGYWRQQMDHITSHLKAHAQNNAEFRALVAEPKIGKLLMATVEEDLYELTMTVTYALKSNSESHSKNAQMLTANHTGNFLSTLMDDTESVVMGSAASIGSAGSTVRSKSSQRSKRTVSSRASSNLSYRGKRSKRKTRTLTVEQKLGAVDKSLLKEVGDEGEGAADQVEELLYLGADANLVNNDGDPVLNLAVRSRHTDAAALLIDAAAKLDTKGSKGNTALHEAVLLGAAGKEMLEMLLEKGANKMVKNDKGETPYDISVRMGVECTITALASSIGQSLLDSLVKPGP